MQEASSTVPILALSDDLVGQGLAQSLARPGANITGISILSTELDSKRQEILMELMPTARRMAALADVNSPVPQPLTPRGSLGPRELRSPLGPHPPAIPR